MNITRNDETGSFTPATVGEFFRRYGIVGRSRAIAKVIRVIELVSVTRSTVLITGETGTGKELVARAVHTRSAQGIECETIRQALEVSPAKRDAARTMGISPRALSHYLAKYPSIRFGGQHHARMTDTMDPAAAASNP